MAIYIMALGNKWHKLQHVPTGRSRAGSCGSADARGLSPCPGCDGFAGFARGLHVSKGRAAAWREWELYCQWTHFNEFFSDAPASRFF